MDIRYVYPQEQHKLPWVPHTICPPGFQSLKPRPVQPWRRLSTENSLLIKIYINYLLKFFLFVLCCIVIYLPGTEFKLTLRPFFSRISDPLKGLSGFFVNYSGI